MGNFLNGKVIKVIDDYQVVINKGYDDGVTKSDRYLIYFLDDELFDPDTNESLGHLEIVCGEGKPTHIQAQMTTLITARQEVTKSKTVVKRGGVAALYGGSVEETYNPETTDIPFDNVTVGCLAKQIK